MKAILDQFRYLTADLRRWRCRSPKDVFYVFFESGVWVTVLYRINRAFFLIDIPGVRIIIRLLGFIFSKVVELVFRVSLSPATDIGPGLYIGHAGNIVIHNQVRAGRNLSVGTGVVIGTRGQGQQDVAVIGNDVYVGVGAKVLGGVTIGNNVNIGANAVVLADVPDGATAVGVPAKIIKINGQRIES